MKRATLAALLLTATFAAAQCTISPSTPVGVNSGSTQQFSASCGTGTTYSVSGDGSVNASTGLYTAPSSVEVHDEDRGCQVSPNNSPWNIAVDGLSVDSKSTRWLARSSEYHAEIPSYHYLKFTGVKHITFYTNPVDNSTPLQKTHFYDAVRSAGYQDGLFPMPSDRTRIIQSGNSIAPTSGLDRHMMTMNKDTCVQAETYNPYLDCISVSFVNGTTTTVSCSTNTKWTVPQGYPLIISGGTGSWAAANGTWAFSPTNQSFGTPGTISGTITLNSSSLGTPTGSLKASSTSVLCNTCQGAGGQQFSPKSYAQLGGTDAASSPLGATSLKMEEWYAATRAGKSDLGHAIGTTLTNIALESINEWPALSFAYPRGLMSITAGTNASPTQLTANTNNGGSTLASTNYTPCDSYTYTAGCTFYVRIYGASGLWAGLNGYWTATAVDNTHFTVPFDATGKGTLPPGVSFDFDFLPYGATLRLKSTVDYSTLCSSASLDNWCPYAKVLLNTIKKYGIVMLDGTIPGSNWEQRVVSSEFHPDVLIDAVTNITAWTAIRPIENYLEVVDRSSQQLSSDPNYWQQTPVGRTQVCVTGSLGSACDDVLLQGTTIGTNRERLSIAASVTYPLNVWVNGNATTTVTYKWLSSGTGTSSAITGATVSSTGIVVMPNCSTKQEDMVVVSSSVDAGAKPLYIDIGCLPVSSDGSYRMALGTYSGDYTDTLGKTWWGSWGNLGSGGFNTFYQHIGMLFGSPMGSWQGFSACANDTWTVTDSQLYSRSANANPGTGGEDMFAELILPNGTYSVTMYGEPGFGGFGPANTCPNVANQNVYDLMANDTTVASNQDGFILAGSLPYNGYTKTASMTISDQVLDWTLRNRKTPTTYGPNISSLLITPTSSGVIITTSSLPDGVVNSSYSATITATGGTSPYTCTYGGSYPPGLTPNSDCTITGTPTLGGDYPGLVVTATDSIGASSPPKTFSIHVSNNTITVSGTLTNGTVGIAYSLTLTASGGTAPYTWTAFCLGLCVDNNVPGLTFAAASDTTATESGTPTDPGAYSLSVQACDAFGVCSATTAYPIIIGTTTGPTTINGAQINGAQIN